MSHTIYRTASCGAIVSFALTCFAQPGFRDEVEHYADFCYGVVGITEDSMKQAFGGDDTKCYEGAATKLTTRHDTIALDPAYLVLGTKNFLTKCDAPAWLGLPSGGPSCYDATYIKTLSFPGFPDVQGALLCRHKTGDPAVDIATGRPTHKDFDDIAMILHNQKTGKTCWFQTPDNNAVLDGNHVPVPHLTFPPPGVKAASDFWLKPSETSGVNCAQCHDNGPWMNSQWLYSQHKDFKDGKGKYETPVFEPGGLKIFDWPKTDDFVEIGKYGLTPDDFPPNSLSADEKEILRKLPECTNCHKLAAKGNFTGRRSWPYSDLLESKFNGTFKWWFGYSTGRVKIPQSTATEFDPRRPRDYAFTHWMPPGSNRPPNADKYNKLYEKHLDELKTCMATQPADRKSPCATTKLAMENAAPAGTGAMVSATNVQTGQRYVATAAPLDSVDPPPPQMLALNQSLQLAWQADATFNFCDITATMPAGVSVPAATSSGSSLIGSGANWQLPETPPVIGPLTEPGIYDLSIRCRDTYTGSLRFQVGTTGARSVLRLVTLVNDTVQATAVHSNNLMQPATTTSVQSTDSVELIWFADNVRASSCILSGPGVASTDEVGSKVIPPPTSIDQVFTFQCTGANDGVFRSVSSTVHPNGLVAADLSISATASSNPVDAGSNLSYTLRVANNGPGESTGVIVTDNLPSTITFVSCAATGGGVCGGTGNNRTITFTSLPSGASPSISLVARVNSSVPGGTVISNTASVSSSTSDPSTTNNSATVAATVSMTVPGAPSSLTATAASTSQINLSWTDNADNETAFQIERSPDGTTFTQIALAGPNVHTFSNTGLTAGATYYYRVRASNSAGNSAYTNIASAKTTNSGLPAAPSNLTAIALLPTRTKLAWTDNSDNESLFLIEHSRDGTTFKQIAGVGVGVTSYIFTLPDMTGGTTHYYRVRASNATGYSEYSNRASLTMPLTPAAPSNLTATALLPTRTKLVWTDNSNNESLFLIEHSRDGITFKQIAGVGVGVTSYIFTLPDMTGGTTHYYRVRASNAIGYSEYSNRASLTMPLTPAAPSNLTATALLPTRTKLVWTDNSNNESLFLIEHSRDGTTFKQIAGVGVGVTSYIFTLPDMTGGTTHYYRVRASNAIGYSEYSNRASLTMPLTPAAPSNLTATALLPTRTKLVWTDNSNNESLFLIEHSRDGITFKQIAGVGVGVTSYIFTLSDMTGGTTHYYRVRASNAIGYSEYSNRASLTMPVQ